MDKFNILIVDDVPENIYSLKMMIEDSFDVRIYSALNAQEGIEILMKENIDLILTDVQMPDIDGFEFVDYIKNIERTKDIPVIFITGIYDKDEYKTKGYNLGAVEYITKPIHDVLLNSKLKVYIDIFERRKEDEKQIAEKEKVLIHQSKMATMGEMIGVIAHQLKQPLNILSLYCNDVKTSYEYNEIDDKFIDDFSKNTKEQIKFLSETIDDFRNFFNPEKNKVQFEIKDAINTSIKLLGNQFEVNEIKLNIEVSDEKVYGSETELEQVILNIINNSIDAFKEKGIKNREINIKVLSKQSYTILIMEDNAGGVKIETLEKLFDPYYTTKANGTGTGLYMVKLVIKNSFQGDLKLSNSELGLRYIIALPQNKF
ncbi:MAG: hybrid sensor histidine kinase/response regulator [Arcobacter sp.]|jgi:C4-dicarboxylate-specific signal transduction histidine kinase|uniref:histidine kinase n=1 Tax=Arcobacter defluvii TaxID=873191 RepID=A0AAE7BFD7_9BACT|nr:MULTISPECIES: hybrid sensor histidine kinase/response regulator [Arcobacter]MDY3200253.1 hybrid sensor histidine kinase/response regulator [Arcobacter sp.]QKF78058.1 two-component system sensor histidine kinase/response regulator fusion protein [Arcobacter defluvii]RXI30002.1 hybrid sensor histidine kinase/response regulator [Arcobacter defluvii]BAK73863.1 two-component response regulator [Arcobacter sp. L]